MHTNYTCVELTIKLIRFIQKKYIIIILKLHTKSLHNNIITNNFIILNISMHVQ